jgi:hypothetical protein
MGVASVGAIVVAGLDVEAWSKKAPTLEITPGIAVFVEI